MTFCNGGVLQIHPHIKWTSPSCAWHFLDDAHPNFVLASYRHILSPFYYELSSSTHHPQSTQCVDARRQTTQILAHHLPNTADNVPCDPPSNALADTPCYNIAPPYTDHSVEVGRARSPCNDDTRNPRRANYSTFVFKVPLCVNGVWCVLSQNPCSGHAPDRGRIHVTKPLWPI